MGSLRRRRRVRIGAADPTPTPVSGMLAVSELCERLDVTGWLDAAIGPIKRRRRGQTAGEVLVGIAAAQLAGEDFLVGLDRQRADVAGQQLAPVPGLAATTAAGLARRFSDAQWAAVQTGLGNVATWADTATVLAAELLVGNEDPRRDAPALLRRALAALPARARAGRIRLRANAGYFAGQLARAALFTDIEFAIGARRTRRRHRCPGCSR